MAENVKKKGLFRRFFDWIISKFTSKEDVAKIDTSFQEENEKDEKESNSRSSSEVKKTSSSETKSEKQAEEKSEDKSEEKSENEEKGMEM